MTDGRSESSTMAAADADPALEEVLEGLSRPQKEISPKYFYDERGSELFETITRLSEYYPTRVERSLLLKCGTRWIQRVRPAALIEFGAGSARKSRVLLDAMSTEGCGELFVPLDVSRDFLEETARVLRAEYPELDVAPEVADMTGPLELPELPPGPALFALLGGTIGNFADEAAIHLLRRIASAMRPIDRFLLGVDLRPSSRKPVALLEAAYNDAEGVTAAFNRNILSVLNKRLGANFDVDAYRHHAFYNCEDERIEMHLVSLGDQEIEIPDAEPISIRRGESIRTEISCKYDRPALEAQLASAGLRVDDWCEDPELRFALALVRR